MTPPPFELPYAPVFWAVYVWAMIPEFRILRSATERAAVADSKDRSLRVLKVSTSTALLVSFPLAFIDRFSFPPEYHSRAFIVGMLLFMGASLLRRWCWRTLGEYFTGDVQARAGQPVISGGPYGPVRHPSYTGGVLMHLGIGVALCSWLSLAVLGLTAMAAYAYRVRDEERLLLETIGEPYRIYMRGRKRFIPYVW